ncbi:MAG TPA: HAMP domain-containing sensor histidine kinase [Polyangia bacterium]|nr:HAMP domain-containing sensor histidine kinase [Polyangia bacterium]
MTIRTKIWLIAVSVAVTVGVASWGRMFITRNRIIKDGQAAAEEIAHDIAEDLKSVEADADDRDLEEKLLGYLNRHSRIVRLDLYVYREASTPSSRIAAPRGDRPEITRFAPFATRQPLGFTKAQGAGEAQEQPIELPVDLKGPWKATLVMKWTLGPVESFLKTEEQISIIFAIGFVVALTLVSGLITDRVVGKPLEVLAGAMRDVEKGDLSRRVPVETVDEVGRLSQGFNRMLERLSQADAQIRAFNQRLAAEIEKATHDLSEKNATLGQLNRLLSDMQVDNASKVRLATLGQLAAQLAHEIGTPLSSVSGHIQLALLQRDLPGALRERLEVSAREVERISKIVRDYLDSTRPLEPERQPTQLPRLLEEAVELVRGTSPAPRATVTCEVDPALGAVVTDPGLLRQIVVNLVSNALDAVDRAGRVSIVAAAEDADVLITVSDTGHGIAPDDLRRIFEPFYTTKGRGKGTGLGLAICRQLTAALGGSISVQSQPGQGSTFYVRLPRDGAPAGSGPGKTTKSTTNPRLRVVGGRA